MKVSYQWLSQYVDIEDISPQELAEKLTRSGVAVDIVEQVNPPLEKIVIGYVTEREQHPNAEKLSLCQVDAGTGETLQIICGAANVAKGQKVPVALVGAKLPDGMKIKKAKLRGIESQGMICSAKELGMNEKLLAKEKTEGILVLPENAEIGEPIESLLGFNDYVLELDLTPNRSDCLSMLGVAYEVAAILERDVKLPVLPENNIDLNHPVKIEIKAPEACSHYAARLVSNITVAESPQWLQNRLIAAGIRPINNIVDITNFVMLEYGQPLHAFDYEQLEQPSIVVRMAEQNEKMVTLDDQERELDDQMLLITDGTKPIAIAGVMGGANSEVTDKTTSILLESAYFNGASVRRTSKQLGLRSEASLRFEKGVDPNRIYAALNRATKLLQEIAGGKVEGDITEDKQKTPEPVLILLRPEKINQLLGTELSAKQMKNILERLRFGVTEQSDGLLVEVPTRRPDVTIEADLAEEIVRLYGYDKIPTTLPKGQYDQGGLNDRQKLRRKIKDQLEAAGLQEVITYSLTGNKQLDLFTNMVKETNKPISLAMPMSEDRKYLRTTLIPHLIEVAQYNINRRNENVFIYEMGTTFNSDENQLTKLPQEKGKIAGLLTGSLPTNWQVKQQLVDFYYVKGVIENLFAGLGINDTDYEACSIQGFHPGRTATIKIAGATVGYIGQLHPDVQDTYDLSETYCFELDIMGLIADYNREIDYKPLPKYPAMQRDISIVVANELPASNLITTIEEQAGSLLENLKLFDVYRSEQLGADKKSIALSLTYRSNERTLTDDEVTELHEKVVDALHSAYGAERRQ